METAAELRIEAARLRGFVGRVTDPAELAAIEAMIDARKMNNGGAADD